jgi:hypothetical protein
MVHGPQYGSACSWVSIPVQSAKLFSTIVAIAVVLAIAGWPHNKAITSILNSNIALQRTWYVLSKFQEKASSRSCKTPHNHHHLHHHHNHFCPPCRHQNKLPLIEPPNNNKWPGDQILPLNFISHQRNMRPWNRLPQRPWPSFDNKLSITIFPTRGRPVLYGYLTQRTGNCEKLLLGPCSPCQSFHSVCCIRFSHHLNLLTSAFIAPRSTIQGIISHPTNFISPPQQKAIPPAMQSCPPPPPWPSCSQVAAAHLHPPPQPSRRLPASTTTTATTQATLTPPGLTTGKATSQAIGHDLIAISVDSAASQATFTPPDWIPGKAMGLSKKVKEAAAQASTI